MTKRTIVGILLVATLALAGCGSSGGSDAGDPIAKDTGTNGEKSEQTDKTDEAESCDGYTAGENDVIRTFCGGSATVDFEIGGNKGSIGGGECANSGGFFSVNAGVVVGPDFSGTAPDYAGFNLPEKDGDFSGPTVVATITTGGETTIIQNVTGTHDADGGSFEGTALEGGDKVSVTFTC